MDVPHTYWNVPYYLLAPACGTQITILVQGMPLQIHLHLHVCTITIKLRAPHWRSEWAEKKRKGRNVRYYSTIPNIVHVYVHVHACCIYRWYLYLNRALHCAMSPGGRVGGFAVGWRHCCFHRRRHSRRVHGLVSAGARYGYGRGVAQRVLNALQELLRGALVEVEADLVGHERRDGWVALEQLLQNLRHRLWVVEEDETLTSKRTEVKQDDMQRTTLPTCIVSCTLPCTSFSPKNLPMESICTCTCTCTPCTSTCTFSYSRYLGNNDVRAFTCIWNTPL